MHKRNVIAVLLTVVVFLSAAALGVSAVYRVEDVKVEASVVSEAAEEEAAELQKRLLESYRNESIFFTDRIAAEKELADFPYFRLISFRRSYPNRLIVTVSEDVEAFAVRKDENSYYILGFDGTVLGTRETVYNRTDGKANVVIEGISAEGTRGEILSGDELAPYLFAFCRAADEAFGGIFGNLLSVKAERPTSDPDDAAFVLTMREGVKAYIGNPAFLTEEKAKAFAEKYASLSDKEKLSGIVRVLDDADGNVRTVYSSGD